MNSMGNRNKLPAVSYDPPYAKYRPPLNAKEFSCGWGSAFINVLVTYPLNKVMFRQMLHGLRTTKAISQIQREGVYFLYRGILPPLCQKTVSVSLMFGMYKQYQETLIHSFPTINRPLCKSFAALLAGWTEAVLIPFERVQVLMQDQNYHNKLNNTLHAVRIIRPYGLSEYYRGAVPILIRNGISNILFFALREHVMCQFPHNNTWWGRITRDFVCGAIIGAFISTVFYPVNVIKTHMQSKLGGEFINIKSAFIAVLEERKGSYKLLFRGVHLNYTRALISWGVINSSYEMLMSLWSN